MLITNEGLARLLENDAGLSEFDCIVQSSLNQHTRRIAHRL
jgi:hypothetical protein